MNRTDKPAIAIIGLGGRFPDADNVEAFWNNICRGHVAIGPVPKDRWDATLWYSDDRSVPDTTYSQIGGFLKPVVFDARRFRIPPRSLEAVDDIQKLALMVMAEALEDAGLQVLPQDRTGRPFERGRTAVILGNAMGGEHEDLTSMRVWFPTVRDALAQSPAVQAMSETERARVLADFESTYKSGLPAVTEDTMPGELSNCIAGRIANAFDLHGPNYTTDAACAASMAALNNALNGLQLGEFDLAIAGGADRQMDPPTYVKFAKIGALSANISAPFDTRANGFVMGEGVGMLVLKRLEDADRDGDRVYAVIRGVGAASDGKGKGITAPNPRGQRLAVERAYDRAGLPIQTVGLFEAHGTSTTVGDATELRVLTECLREAGAAPVKTPIGSVKSMIGHLKSAAGAASMIKATLALHHRTLPPSANFETAPEQSPLHEGYLEVCRQAREWTQGEQPRRAGVSAFGFGGTNFHVVLEEYVPPGQRPIVRPVAAVSSASVPAPASAAPAASVAPDAAAVLEDVIRVFAEATGYERDELDPTFNLEADLGIDTVKQAEVIGELRQRYQLPQDDTFKLSDVPTLEAIAGYVASAGTVGASSSAPSAEGPSTEHESPPASEPAGPWVVIFGGATKEEAVAAGQARLAAATDVPDLRSQWRQALKAPVRLAFAAHSLDEAGAKLGDALSGRARRLQAQGIFWGESAGPTGDVGFLFPGQGSQYLGMFRDLAATYPVVADTFAEADRVLEPLIGARLTDIVWPDATDEAADLALRRTEICQPAMLTADVAMLRLLMAHGVRPHIVAGHSLGEYGACVAAGVLSFPDALYAVSARGREMAHVKVDDNGKMATVAAGAEKVEEILKSVDGYVIAANKNCHAQTVIAGTTPAVESALERFAELNLDARPIPVSHAFHCRIVAPAGQPLRRILRNLGLGRPQVPILSNVTADYYPSDKEAMIELMGLQLESPVEFIAQIERMFQDGARTFVEVGPRRAATGFVTNVLQGQDILAVATNHHKKPGLDGFAEALAAMAAAGLSVDLEGRAKNALSPVQRFETAQAGTTAKPTRNDASLPVAESLVRSTPTGEPVVSGMSVLAPSAYPVPDWRGDAFGGLLAGDNYIEQLDPVSREQIANQRIVRLNKETGTFEPLRTAAEVVKLAARLGKVDLVGEYGLGESFNDALDASGRLAIAATIDALRDAGLPLVRRYRTTSTGRQLPDRWGLPEPLARTTGVVMASAFPSHDRVVEAVSEQLAAQLSHEHADAFHQLVERFATSLSPHEADRLRQTFAPRLAQLRDEADRYQFNRKFLLRVMAMGHAQVAQTILAQGPNTLVNAACASGTQAVGIACDWLQTDRCERVVVVSADAVTDDAFLPWAAAGFLAAGAATVEDDVATAAVPFGKGRNGLILGAGASAFVIEKAGAPQARGLTPIASVVTAKFANSAFHATRLEQTSVAEMFTDVVSEVAASTGLSSEQLAKQTFFVSHETYTPARGGSSAAEVNALRRAFGDAVTDVTIANTKGQTGHPMGATLEDVVALKGLQRQVLPPVANLREVDPEFADLCFARGSKIQAEFALRFAAGFGSQMAAVVYRRLAHTEERLTEPGLYAQWLQQQTGRTDVGLEVVKRTLRVAETGGEAVWDLGIRSLMPVPAGAAETASAPADAASAVVSPAPTVPAAARSKENLLAEITQLFADQTGYDVADFEPAFELEADLGVDTVKQAEIFSLLRERYSLPQDESFRLSDVPTLATVVEYVMAHAGTAPAAPNGDTTVIASQVPEPAAVSQSATTAQTAPASHGDEAVSRPNRDTLLAEITALFAEQTGYEVDDFEPAFELEADLGVDTVKQAEIFSLLRERYGLPQDDAFRLADVPTLNAVVDYVLEQWGRGQPPPPPPPERAPEAETAVPSNTSVSAAAPASMPGTAAVGAADGVSLLAEVTALFAEQTGYALEDFDPEHELEADLGIDTVKQAEIFSLLRQRYGLPQDESFRLSDVPTLAAVADYVARTRSIPAAPSAPTPETSLDTATADITSAPLAAQRPTFAQPPPSALSVENRGILLAEITQLFAEQTGYDVSDFEPQFELEADLGVDTVKQAEIFSVLRQRYGLPQDDAFRLADVPTLDAVVDYVARAGTQADADVSEVGASTDREDEAISRPEGMHAYRVQIREVTALPAPKRSIAGRTVAVVGADAEWVAAWRACLRARGAQVLTVAPDFDAQTLEEILRKASPAVTDAVFVVGEGLAFEPEALQSAARTAFITSQALGRVQGTEDVGLLFVGRSAGVLGEGSDDPTGLLLGAVAGLAKTLKKEWPHACVLAADLAAEQPLTESIEAAADAWLSDAACELGWRDGALWTLVREQVEVASEQPLRAGATVVATGGARGVTYAILRRLAERGPFDLVVLARTPAVAPDASPLAGKSEAEQKALAKTRLSDDGRRVTPAAIRGWIEKERSRIEVAENLEALRALGCRVELMLCDVSEPTSLAEAVARLQARGSVDVLLHGAGIESSKFILDKDPEVFDRVFAPKATAALRLWQALKPRRMVTMGSIAGRFGNGGQADYAAANELMAALARRPEHGVVNVGWTAWDDIGMATRGSVKHVLEELGVQLIPAAYGARLGADVVAAAAPGDWVVAGALGKLAYTEALRGGTLAPVPTAAEAAAEGGAQASDAPSDPLFDRVESEDGVGIYVRRLDPARDLGLDDHRIDGVVLLPGVLGLELMVRGAVAHCGKPATRVRQVRFAQPLKLFKDQALEARVEVTPDLKGDTAAVELVSIFEGPNGKRVRRAHFEATVVLGSPIQPEAPPVLPLELPRTPGLARADIYSRYFHGPRFQVLGEIPWLGEDGIAVKPHPAVQPWVAGNVALRTQPELREAGFQAAGLWEMVELGRMALPSGIEDLQLGPAIPEGAEVVVEARLRAAKDEGSVFDVWVRDTDGNIYDVMLGYRTITLRDLTASERFEPLQERGEAPRWLWVDVAQVQAVWSHDADRLLNRYLSPGERRHYAELKSDKRRVEWLAGRIAAKRLLRQRRYAQEGAIIPYGAITILADSLGAPGVSIVGENEPPPRLSISHSAGWAAALASSETAVAPGIDVERVEARAESFGEQFFTSAEQEYVAASSQPNQMLTALWAVKEAMLKALGIGARVDLRDVEVQRQGEAWEVRLRNEAAQEGERRMTGQPAIEVELFDDRVVARILLPVRPQSEGAADATPNSEVSL